MSLQRSDNDKLGLMANGSCGAWEVAVDETTAGPNRWFVEIEGPTAYCSFEISSPEIVCKTLEFLGGRGLSKGLPIGIANSNGSLVIGKHPKTPVILIKDDEYPDRYFLMVGPDNALARVSIAGNDLKDLTEALRQAVEDIEDDS
jgi:hypothetical protein